MNFGALNGLRCLATICVTAYHVFWAFGGLFFLSTDPCLQAIRRLSFIGPTFFSISFQMTLFWTISGFLCEYQLDQLRQAAGKRNEVGASLDWKDYGRFLLNRFLRLYTLYILVCLLGFANPSPDFRCTPTEMIKSSLFIMDFENPGVAACAGHGWSIMVDVHGYLALLLCYAIVRRSTMRKYLFAGLYALAVGNLAYIKSQAPSDGYDPVYLSKFNQGGWVGAEFLLPVEKDLLVYSGQLNIRDLYPNVDFDRSEWVALRGLRHYLGSETYFTSVLRHGSAIFLGAFLYEDLREQENRIQNTSIYLHWLKVIAIGFALYATDYWFGYSGVASYLLVETVLTAPPSVMWLWDNRLWSTLAPYTYGVYIFHLVVVVGMALAFHQGNAALVQNDGVSLDDISQKFTVAFVLQTSVIVLVISWTLSFVSYHTIEWPARYLRRKFVLPKKDTAVKLKK